MEERWSVQLDRKRKRKMINVPPSTYKNYKLYPGTLDRLYYTSYKTVSLHIIFFHFSSFLTSLRQGTNGYLHFPCKIVEILYVGVLFNIIGRRSCPAALNIAQKGTGIVNHRLPVDNQSLNGSLLSLISSSYRR